MKCTVSVVTSLHWIRKKKAALKWKARGSCHGWKMKTSWMRLSSPHLPLWIKSWAAQCGNKLKTRHCCSFYIIWTSKFCGRDTSLVRENIWGEKYTSFWKTLLTTYTKFWKIVVRGLICSGKRYEEISSALGEVIEAIAQKHVFCFASLCAICYGYFASERRVVQTSTMEHLGEQVAEDEKCEE